MTALDFPTSPVAGQEYNGFVWDDVVGAWKPFNIGNYGFKYVDTVYFTSSGTFSKATYPWLRAIRVKCQGAGGGGGGVATTGASQVAFGGGGGGGVYAESFITDIAGLDASITVTRGAGGAGGAAGNNAGSAGGNSSFGSLVVGDGGLAGGGGASVGSSNTQPYLLFTFAAKGSGTGDLIIPSAQGVTIPCWRADFNNSVSGGGSHYGAGATTTGTVSGANGNNAALGHGGGGGGGVNCQNQGTGRTGGAGGNGIVIVELFA
jgi:hypothetical protein